MSLGCCVVVTSCSLMESRSRAGEEHDRFYATFVDWLEGASIEDMKVKLGV